MRGFLVVIGLAAMITVGGAALALALDFPGAEKVVEPVADNVTDEVANDNNREATSTSGSNEEPTPISESAPSATATGDSQPTTPISTPTGDEEPEDEVVPIELPDLQVDDPQFTLFSSGHARVNEQYSEFYTFEGDITVSWRPGAYPPEYAEDIAGKARDAVDEINEKLHTGYDGPVEILLADQLFNTDCVGCQGYTAADTHWVFLLDDGSLTEAEFDALLVHEVAHLVAAQKIYLPHNLFFAEGLATWIMTDTLTEAGYLSPLQTTAWVHRAGALPSLSELFDDDFGGRMRKRVAYDASAAFAFFIIDEYGWPAYRKLYTLDPPEQVTGKDWEALEQDWHSYLDGYADNTVNGTDAESWWSAASRVIDAYARFYEDPSLYDATQYRELSLSRVALTQGGVEQALSHLSSSGLGVQTAQ